ncbi:MAG: hypothetical protein KJO96_04600 [Winogradskyella sp.]|nr:hypothetical protein [Winogradskyella sp.]
MKKLLDKIIPPALFFLLITSCNFKEETSPTQAIPKEEWKNIKELYGNWTQLERDSIGYLHYKPCDGKTPSLLILKDSIILSQQIESPINLKIDSYKIKRDSIVLNVSSKNLNAEFTFRIVNSSAKFILFKWNYLEYMNTGKEIITRENLAKSFRQVENPCHMDKVSEMVFLPVEFK